jgi:aldose 1-epimerase
MKSSTQKSNFGQLPDGTVISLYTLTNSQGAVAKVTNYGATLTELHVPGRDGELTDVVLGFDRLEPYLKGHPFFGSTVGRVANRIAKGRFQLDGKVYQLAVNNGPNHLHGGLKGFDKVAWQAAPQPGAAVEFTYTSPDGEEGYPGKVDVTVTMSLTDDNAFKIAYRAVADQPTPVNLTNHSYFNLAGTGDILQHELWLAADFFTPSDETNIPSGEIRSVKGGPMDFTVPQTIGSRLFQLPNQPVGYDHNYLVRSSGQAMALAARVREPASGRILEMLTTQPGFQFYTGNYLDGSLQGKGGWAYGQHAGFCLETQHYPDSVNHPHFPSVILRPGQTFHHETVYRFSVQ